MNMLKSKKNLKSKLYLVPSISDEACLPYTSILWGAGLKGCLLSALNFHSLKTEVQSGEKVKNGDLPWGRRIQIDLRYLLLFCSIKKIKA
jgi:hypothetical protein